MGGGGSVSLLTDLIHIKIHWVMWCLVGGHSCSSVLPEISYNYLYSSAVLFLLFILLSLVRNKEECSFQQCTQVIKTH